MFSKKIKSPRVSPPLHEGKCSGYKNDSITWTFKWLAHDQLFFLHSRTHVYQASRKKTLSKNCRRKWPQNVPSSAILVSASLRYSQEERDLDVKEWLKLVNMAISTHLNMVVGESCHIYWQLQTTRASPQECCHNEKSLIH